MMVGCASHPAAGALGAVQVRAALLPPPMLLAAAHSAKKEGGGSEAARPERAHLAC